MNKIRLKLGLCLILLTIMLAPTHMSWAASGVSVSIPQFDVHLNGINIDNTYKAYPLIVYKGITYFPMTYYDSRFMGLETMWDATSGLQILKNGGTWDYKRTETLIQNKNTYQAEIAPFDIRVNGNKIDNSSQEYPLLVFREVTYFPLTWDFAVEAFAWEDTFDPDKGLTILSSKESVPVTDVILPMTNHKSINEAFTMAGDYYYYQGEEGEIFQIPIDHLSQADKIYQLPKIEADGYPASSLYTDHGKAFLKYHTGGAIMGSDHFVYLKSDGTSQEIETGYLSLKCYDDLTIKVNQGFPPMQDNLLIKMKGETDYKHVGNPNMTYGFYMSQSDLSNAASFNDDVVKIDNNIYLLGYENSTSSYSTTGLYSVDIQSNESKRICDNEVNRFKLVDDNIYFIGGDMCLYKLSIEGGQAVCLVDKAVEDYEISGDQVYYSLADDQHLRILGQDKSINESGTLTRLDQQGDYLISYFNQKSDSAFHMMIFNKEGALIYKTLESIDEVSIQEGKTVFIKRQ